MEAITNQYESKEGLIYLGAYVRALPAARTGRVGCGLWAVGLPREQGRNGPCTLPMPSQEA